MITSTHPPNIPPSNPSPLHWAPMFLKAEAKRATFIERAYARCRDSTAVFDPPAEFPTPQDPPGTLPRDPPLLPSPGWPPGKGREGASLPFLINTSVLPSISIDGDRLAALTFSCICRSFVLSCHLDRFVALSFSCINVKLAMDWR